MYNDYYYIKKTIMYVTLEAGIIDRKRKRSRNLYI